MNKKRAALNLAKHAGVLVGASAISAVIVCYIFAMLYPGPEAWVPLPIAAAYWTFGIYTPGTYVFAALCYWMTRRHLKWKVPDYDSGAALVLAITLIIVTAGALALALMLRHGVWTLR